MKKQEGAQLSFSKDTIRNRMLQNAAQLWGVNNINNLDPFVKLLVDAFAVEIFNVSNQVADMQDRLVVKVSNLLTPTIYSLSRPAHAVLLTPANREGGVLPDRAQFSYRGPARGKGRPEEVIRFTPVDNIALYNARIECIAVHDTCKYYKLSDSIVPEVRQYDTRVEYGKMWVSVVVDDEQEAPDQLSLFFECTTHEHHNWLYKLLSYTTVTLGNTELRVKPGRHYNSAQAGTERYTAVFDKTNTIDRLTANIKLYYDNQFLTLSLITPEVFKAGMAVPDELRHIEIDESKKRIWLKLSFLCNYTPKELKDFNIYLNAFPVYNRSLCTTNATISFSGDIVPLRPGDGEAYLALQSVEDDAGNQFKSIPGLETSAGHYALRDSGVERMDERDALDMLDYALEMARDEIAAFTPLGRDAVKGNASDIAQAVRRLKQTLDRSAPTIKKRAMYLVMNPLAKGQSNIQANYWTTAENGANNIRSGAVLSSNEKYITGDNCMLLTTTIGGAPAPKGENLINAFRYELLTRDRIITPEDVKNFCYLELGDIIKEIAVKPGTAISYKPKEGFIQTTYVLIEPQDYEQHAKENWAVVANRLGDKLQIRSISDIGYTVQFHKVLKSF